MIPRGARDAVTRRLDALSPEVRAMLTIAAVAGREFEPAVVELASGRSAGEVAGALGQALEARVIAEHPNPEWLSFAHAIVREAIYAQIGAAKRADLHGRVGEAIEAVHGTEPPDLPRRPRAALLRGGARGGAGEGDRVRAAGRRAGDRAARARGRGRSLREGARAARRAPRSRTTRGASGSRLELGRSRTLSGRFAEARETFEAAAALARELGDGEALARGGARHVARRGHRDGRRAAARAARGGARSDRARRLGAAGRAPERAHLAGDVARSARRGGRDRPPRRSRWRSGSATTTRSPPP